METIFISVSQLDLSGPSNTVLINGASRYRIGVDGALYSHTSGQWERIKPRWYGGVTANKGRRYLSVVIYDDKGKKRERRIHHLVAEHFIGPRPAGALVLHRNDDPADNRVENLYYGSRLDNTLDAVRHGRSCIKTKFTKQDIAEIRKSPLGCIALGKLYGVDRTTIWKIKTGKAWAA